MEVVLGGENSNGEKTCNLLTNLLKLMNFGVIVQNDELHKILDHFSSAAIPSNKTAKRVFNL